MKNDAQLTIGWLYPQLMSTYGDRGNILVLQKRCEWRGIKVEIINIDQSTNDQRLMTIDLLFGGGAQDREQEIVMKDLMKKKKAIKTHIENNRPALFVCGAPQLMGEYYEPAEGKKIKGLGIFDMTSKHPGPKQDRLIGNVVAKINWENLNKSVITTPDLIREKQSQEEIAMSPLALRNDVIIGFENHGGRTYLGKSAKPFAKVVKGFGNNGKDGNEGVVYKNAIGSYLHGPLLPKNPQLADWLIAKALEIKYKKEFKLLHLDESLEQMAKETIANRLGVKV
jgi:lipid II isoglutaminyl synthase (glutamine-hydrolysing)